MMEAITAVPTTCVECRTPEPSMTSSIEHFELSVNDPSTDTSNSSAS